MAVPVYSNDLTTIAVGDLNYDAGTWDESSDGGWDTAGAMVDDLNLYYTDNIVNTGEADNSCTSAQYTKDGTGTGNAGPGTIIYNHNATFTVPTDGVISIDSMWAAPPALNPYAGTFGTAEAGVSVLIGSSLGDFDVHYVAGDDLYPATDGVYATYFVDPTVTPAGTIGTVTTLTAVGIGIAAVAQARGNPNAVQSIRYGRGEVEYTVGDLTTPATFEGYAIIDNTLADKFNLLQEVEGGYKARGLMSFGTATTAVYFDDSDKFIVIADDLKVGSAFNKGIVTNALSVLKWTNIAITNLSAIAKYTFTVNDSSDTDHSGCVFTDLGTFIYGSNSVQSNTTFRRQELVTQGSSTFTSCVFDNPVGTVGLASDNLSAVIKCDFKSNGTGYAVSLGTISADTSVVWDNTESGYAATDGATGNETISVSVDTGITLTINVSSTGSTPTIHNSGLGTVNVVSGAIILKFVVKDINTDPVVGAYAYIDDNNASPFILNTTTDSNGEASISYSDGAVIGTTWRIRKYGYKPFVQTIDIGGIDITIPVTLNIDPQQT